MTKKIILLSGKLGSGKNQTSCYLKELVTNDNKILLEGSFAKTLKTNIVSDFRPLSDLLNKKVDELKNLINFVKQTPCGSFKVGDELTRLIEDFKLIADNFYENKTDISRTLLQIYGTNIFRDRVDKNYWIRCFINECRSSKFDVMTVTDVRFENEIFYLKDNLVDEFDIISIRIDRPAINRNNLSDLHPSETSLDNFKHWDYKIVNDGTLEDLKNKIVTIYNHIKEE